MKKGLRHNQKIWRMLAEFSEPIWRKNYSERPKQIWTIQVHQRSYPSRSILKQEASVFYFFSPIEMGETFARIFRNICEASFWRILCLTWSCGWRRLGTFFLLRCCYLDDKVKLHFGKRKRICRQNPLWPQCKITECGMKLGETSIRREEVEFHQEKERRQWHFTNFFLKLCTL